MIEINYIKINNSKVKSNFIIFLSIATFVGLAVLGMNYSCTNMYKCYDSKSWIKCNASIIEVVNVIEEDSESTSQKIAVKYKYQIDNSTFINDEICIGYGFNSFENHNAIFDKLEHAKTITIYYNPKKKSESVIAKGFNNSTIMFFYLCLSLVFFLSLFAIPIIWFVILTRTIKNYSVLKPILFSILMFIIIILLFAFEIPNIEITDSIEVLDYKPQ